MGTIIRGGTLVTAGNTLECDLRLDGGRVAAAGSGILQPGDQIIDAEGCLVMPGGIDPHTHIDMPAGNLKTVDDWYDATAAALAGGTTCCIDMMTQEPGGKLRWVLEDWNRRAGPRAAMDYSYHMGVIDPRPDVLEEMPQIVAAGIPSFKLYLAYKGRIMVDDAGAYRTMRAAGRAGAWTLVHCENGEVVEILIAEALAAGRTAAGVHGEVRPAAAEAEATGRAIALAQMAGCPVYIVHVTCQGALEHVRRARRAGQQVRAEACAHHLVLTADEYRRPGFAAAPWVLSPPLRSELDQRALWGGLRDGSLDTVATDHCPWHLKGQKDRGRDDFTRIPNGAPGIEERMALLWTYGVAAGSMTPQQFVAYTSTHAAQIFGLYPRKGSLLPGADADVVVWDPQVERKISARTHRTRADHSIYEGMAVRGAPRYVFVRGRPAVWEGELQAEPGWGQFLARRPLGKG